jgi:hypothetical protein
MTARRFDIEIDGSRLGYVYAKTAMDAAKRFVNGGWCLRGDADTLRYECPVGRDGYEYTLGETRFVVRLIRASA